LDQLPPMHVALNACPALDAFAGGLTRLAKGGCFCLFSGFTDQREVAVGLLNEVHYRQLRVVGAYGCTRRQMQQALQLLNRYPSQVELLIERRLRLEDVAGVLPGIVTGQALKYVVET
jgi:L-iditol 2-dehydrogenase